ncbi:hypothetical protein C5167_033569 [Papaver somniferum]|uniref:Uncharacterized protein n=1 Tax=Papaver somniferum TaxID=3469 RepID=A0A4Y7KEH7_PAPSO|nr:hypothetical protein C5167_033569 [Papaver somniferum]
MPLSKHVPTTIVYDENEVSSLRKRLNTKPSHGPIHFRLLLRSFGGQSIGSMIPHKTKRGAAALARFKAYEGIPPPYDKAKRMFSLLLLSKIWFLKLQPGQKYCLLGRLSSEVGWTVAGTIKYACLAYRHIKIDIPAIYEVYMELLSSFQLLLYHLKKFSYSLLAFVFQLATLCILL